MSKKIAQRLLQARTKSGLSLRALALKVGSSKTQLQRVEMGLSQPSERLLRALCKEFDLDFDALWQSLGRVPEDVTKFIVKNPKVLKLIRKELER